MKKIFNKVRKQLAIEIPRLFWQYRRTNDETENLASTLVQLSMNCVISDMAQIVLWMGLSQRASKFIKKYQTNLKVQTVQILFNLYLSKRISAKCEKLVSVMMDFPMVTNLKVNRTLKQKMGDSFNSLLTVRFILKQFVLHLLKQTLLKYHECGC